MSDKEIENGIRNALRIEFPDTAFSVSYSDEDLDILVLGGFLKKYGDCQNFPDEIQDRIQNAVFSVAPIWIFFEEQDYL